MLCQEAAAILVEDVKSIHKLFCWISIYLIYLLGYNVIWLFYLFSFSGYKLPRICNLYPSTFELCNGLWMLWCNCYTWCSWQGSLWLFWEIILLLYYYYYYYPHTSVWLVFLQKYPWLCKWRSTSASFSYYLGKWKFCWIFYSLLIVFYRLLELNIVNVSISLQQQNVSAFLIVVNVYSSWGSTNDLLLLVITTNCRCAFALLIKDYGGQILYM